MPTLNLGILAHVDAGKTSLTERLLFDTGTIGRLGSVDAGSTQTDTNDIERQRGITIRTAVASFSVGDLQVNLIDTPGHSDFIAEVERALAVLDAAVLVISAVEGVQPHTRILMRTLRKLRLPTLIFVNKIDRVGARDDALVSDIHKKLAARVATLNRVSDIGTSSVSTMPKSLDGRAIRTEIAELLAENDDVLLAELVADRVPCHERVETAIASQTAMAQLHPLFFGSALSGAGVPDLLAGVRRFLPPAAEDEKALQGTVFAIKRGRMGEKLAYLRLYGGQVRTRDRLRFRRRAEDGNVSVHKGQVTALEVVGHAGSDRLTAGNIALIGGMPGVRVGDRVGAFELSEGEFPPPSLETVVRAKEADQIVRLRSALLDLADQDPLIQTRMLPGGETSVLLYGEVQKEVIAATLEAEFGVRAVFEPSRTVYFERPIGIGEVEDAFTYFNSHLAIRIEPGPPGSGLVYRMAGERGTLREAYHHAVEEAVHRTLEQGLYGWALTDCVVSLTRSAYRTGSVTADFRNLTPLLVMRALQTAGTTVYEPCEAFELQIPPEVIGPVTSELMAAEGKIWDSSGDETDWVLQGQIPTRRVHRLRQQIPGLTSGEGAWWSRPEGDRAVDGAIPVRERTGSDPLDIEEYLRFLARRGLPW